MKYYFLVVCTFISCLTLDVTAQQKGGSLSNKWEKMLEEAETYQFYKVIKKEELNSFWKATKDTIKLYQEKLQVEKDNIKQQENKIKSLETELSSLNMSLKTVQGEKESLTFLGLTMNKIGYVSMLSLIILVCLVMIVFLLYLYKNSQTIAIEKVDLYQKISQEFTEYKQLKFETEKKLKRELQTQINKLEELKRK